MIVINILSIKFPKFTTLQEMKPGELTTQPTQMPVIVDIIYGILFSAL